MLTTALVIGVALATGLVLWKVVSIVIRQQRDRPIRWNAASSQQRLIAGGVGVVISGAWLGMFFYVAPTLISAIRGQGLPWSDLSPFALLLDAVTVCFVAGIALTGGCLGDRGHQSMLQTARAQNIDDRRPLKVSPSVTGVLR
ncbi:Uncharacterised protein [Mycobacteroides abscessus subsp. abscessus]|nr:Uncharacterised protein [Mycobacteroides abscessus subsp. abscessus]SIK57329.1 Uncharacterised protein [Mycobacteroides abscessus subsp. abscessus]SIL84180.1 Uncharacterised protein [Mycobacteroides abscessus subsp. abscessus]SIM12560.1 Uncharacterised protein [Mycobacteroides abscessus subsp. abscessus]SIM33414.1 Uncharacterised protein [Mycobacteroides abscessus subsp. abscessus]